MHSQRHWSTRASDSSAEKYIHNSRIEGQSTVKQVTSRSVKEYGKDASYLHVFLVGGYNTCIYHFVYRRGTFVIHICLDYLVSFVGYFYITQLMFGY